MSSKQAISSILASNAPPPPSSLPTPDKETYMEPDGTLATYTQIYKSSDQEVLDAKRLEEFILDKQEDIQGGMLSIGAALVEFNDRELYKATGHPSFHVWAQQPMFHFSYEHATRMMRIVTDLLPILGPDTKNIPIAILKELLPMVRSGSSPAAIQSAVRDIEGLNTRDATKVLRQLRGVSAASPPFTIKATVHEGTDYNKLEITMYDNKTGDIYKAGTLNIKKRDFSFFEGSINGTWLMEDALP